MIKNRVFFEGLLATLCLTAFTLSETLADTPREIAKRASQSVMLLVMEDESGQPLSMASGFVVREGIVATNLHVIRGAYRGYARPPNDKTKYSIAGTVGIDAMRDLVLLRVEKLKSPALPIGDSKKIAAGDEVYAVGNPRGLEGTFSAGIVSSVRNVGDDYLLQITAPVSPGSSGGPVVNSKGEVVGVSVATFKGGQNLNFAIPSSYLASLMAAPPQLAKLAGQVTDAKAQEKSILNDLGGSITDAVVGSDCLWLMPGNQFDGRYSFSLRNKLRESIRNVVCLVVFHNDKGEALDIDLVTYEGVIPGGLAKRVRGNVDGSVKMLTSGQAETPKTKIEFRVLSFDIVDSDSAGEGESPGPALRPEAPGGRSVRPQMPAMPQMPPGPGDGTGSNRDMQDRLKKAQDELAKADAELAKAVAKIAPAGDGPDLIESNIDGDFEGWEGETVFKLENGQVWQQVNYDYTYHFAFRPKVFIIKTNGAYKMKVEGVSDTIFVRRIK